MKKKTARLRLAQEATERTKQGETKNKTKQNTKNSHQYEQKCQCLTK
jgi:predicted DNA-binding protein